MGDPKRIRKKYKTPRQPFDKNRIETELQLIGKYGLRNMKEVWKHSTMIGNFRGNARHLLSLEEEDRIVGEKELLGRLQRMGLLSTKATLDNVLGLEMEDILQRRLQTLVFKQGLACTPYHARQMIVHGHIAVNGQIAKSPSQIIDLDEEKAIDFAPNSPFQKTEHNALPGNVYKTAEKPEKKEKKREKKAPKVKPKVKKSAKELVEEEEEDVDVLAVASDDEESEEKEEKSTKKESKK